MVWSLRRLKGTPEPQTRWPAPLPEVRAKRATKGSETCVARPFEARRYRSSHLSLDISLMLLVFGV